MHHSLCPWEPGTSVTFTCIKSECPAQAQNGGGGEVRAGVSNDWCITDTYRQCFGILTGVSLSAVR